MRIHVRPVLVMFAFLTLLTGAIYPTVITVVAQVVFPQRANGSVLTKDGKLIGSELIGQPFDHPRYFWGRPSATAPFPYNSAFSTGSNLGPTNPALLDAVRDRVATMRNAHPYQTGPVPIEMVTASGSGLDPHISPAAAEYQVLRVANARRMGADGVRQLVAIHTEGRSLGVLGEPRINVLRLNLALDGRD